MELGRLALAFPFLFVACGGDAGTAPSALAGTYTMTAVNGQPLPVVVPDGAIEYGVQRGALSLEADGRFDFGFSGYVLVDDRTYGMSFAGCTGAWSRDGWFVRFEPDEGAQCPRPFRGAADARGKTLRVEVFRDRSTTFVR